MSELNLIKTVLFNAHDLNEALTRLDELNILYTKSDIVGWYSLDNHDINFWPINSRKCPLAVSVNGEIQAYDDRVTFLAGKHETVGASVPAVSPDTACQRPTCPVCESSSVSTETSIEPNELFHTCQQCDYDWFSDVIPKQSTETVDKPRFSSARIHLKIPQLRAILRSERLYKKMNAVGLSS